MYVCGGDKQWDNSGEEKIFGATRRIPSTLKISLPLYETVDGVCEVCGEENQWDDSGEEKIDGVATRRRFPLCTM